MLVRNVLSLISTPLKAFFSKRSTYPGIIPKSYFDLSVNGVSFRMIRVEGYDFYLGETPVTQKLWKAITGTNPSNNIGLDNPVDSVSLDDCISFIRRLNDLTAFHFRLPYSYEWLKGAEGGIMENNSLFSGSDNLDSVGWYRDNSGGKTHPVKQKMPNQIGLYDMSGNVCEWCIDTGLNPSKNIIAGGDFESPFNDCKLFEATQYNAYHPKTRRFNVGFRLLLPCKVNG